MEMIYKNKNFTKRNYECTNIVACISNKAPNNNFIEADEKILDKLTHIYTQSGVQYFGYL